MSAELQKTPSWPKVEAARAALAKARAAGDAAGVKSAQAALGEAFTACRAEAPSPVEAAPPPPATDSSPEDSSDVDSASTGEGDGSMADSVDSVPATPKKSTKKRAGPKKPLRGKK